VVGNAASGTRMLLDVEFEEAAHKREHEYRLHIDQLNADLLSHQLRVCCHSFTL